MDLSVIGAFLSSVGPTIPYVGLVALVIVSIFRGWLVPGNIMTARIKDKDDQLLALAKERDDWRTAFQKNEEAKQTLLKQNSDLIEAGRTTSHMIESLRNIIERSNMPAPTYQQPAPYPTQAALPPTGGVNV